MFFCLGIEGSKSSLFRNGWFQCFSVKELKVPMVPYLKRVFHMFFCLGTEGSKCSQFGNVWFQWFFVLELKVPKVPYLEMGGSYGFLFKIGRASCRERV